MPAKFSENSPPTTKLLPKTTFVRIVFGFDKNRHEGSKWYRRGEGNDLVNALKDLFRRRYNNPFRPEQKNEILSQFVIASQFVEQISKQEITSPEKVDTRTFSNAKKAILDI